MKLLILLAALTVSRGAKLDRNYLPPTGSSNSEGSGLLETPKLSRPGASGTSFGHHNNFRSQNQPSFNSGPSGINDVGQNGIDSGNVNAFENQNYELEGESRPERPQAALERSAGTLREENENNGEAFSFLFETENGIYAEESGTAANGVQAQGGYSYTGDDGQVYSITYTADENGFVPQGEHLPTPPPVPEDILRALEQNAKDEAAGIFDDGSYDESKYAEYDQNQQVINGNFHDSSNIQSFPPQGNDENTIATQAAAYLPPRENLQRNPSGRFRSTGNGPAFPNGPTNLINNAITSQTAAYLPPHRGNSGRGRQSQRIPSGENGPNAYRNVAQNEFASHSRPVHNQRPSSYEVPLQSRTPVQGGPDEHSNGFGGRTQNLDGRPTRPSFNDRTGYNY